MYSTRRNETSIVVKMLRRLNPSIVVSWLDWQLSSLFWGGGSQQIIHILVVSRVLHGAFFYIHPTYTLRLLFSTEFGQHWNGEMVYVVWLGIVYWLYCVCDYKKNFLFTIEEQGGPGSRDLRLRSKFSSLQFSIEWCSTTTRSKWWLHSSHVTPRRSVYRAIA